MMGGWLLWIGDEGCSPIRVVYNPKGPILLDMPHCSYAVLGLLCEPIRHLQLVVVL